MSCTLSSPIYSSQGTEVDGYFQTQQSQESFMLLVVFPTEYLCVVSRTGIPGMD